MILGFYANLVLALLFSPEQIKDSKSCLTTKDCPLWGGKTILLSVVIFDIDHVKKGIWSFISLENAENLLNTLYYKKNTKKRN